MAHPAPPFYRTAKPGKLTQRITLDAPVTGAHRPNACVPPVVHSDMIGNRVLFENRSVRISAPKVDL